MANRYFNPTVEETEAISKEPYIIELVEKVTKFAIGHCYAKNLYAWREFIHDLQVDLTLFIYDYELAYRKGLHGKTGFSAYCNAAKQQAINWAMHYSAQKRRLNSEAVSIDASYEDEDRAPIQIASTDTALQEIELLNSIGSTFGKVAMGLCEQLLNGETLSKEDLKKLKNIPQLKEFLVG